eukprot:4162553-Pyramimonas_sp.AAC.1
MGAAPGLITDLDSRGSKARPSIYIGCQFFSTRAHARFSVVNVRASLCYGRSRVATNYVDCGLVASSSPQSRVSSDAVARRFGADC